MSADIIPQWIFNVQAFFCFVVACSVAILLSTHIVRHEWFFRVPLCLVGAGSIVTVAGLASGCVYAIQIGYILENTGVCGVIVNMMVFGSIVRRKEMKNPTV